jgi:hypothetical protein
VGGSTLATWNDKSANRLVGTAINSPTYQTNIQNGQAVIRFNGTNQYIDFGNVLNLGTNGLTVFMVTKFSINPGNQVGMIAKTSYRGNPGRWGMAYDTVAGGPNGVGVNFFIEDTNQSLTGIVVNPATQFNIFTAVNNRTSTNILYANGNFGSQQTFSASANNLSNTDPLYVASYPNETATAPRVGMFLNGDIGEIVVYFATLTDAQRQQVEGYLAWKWGLVASLPNGHPFKQPPIAPFPYAVRRAVPGPSLSSFSLRSISGITLWMDAADASTLTLSGTSVTQWRDKSISGYVFTSPSPPVSGVNTMNGLNVVTNQGSQYLQITNYSQTFTTCSFFVVMKPTGSFGSWDFLGIFMSQTTGAPYFYIELSATMVPNRYSFATTVNGRDAFAGNLGSNSVSGITYLLSGFVTGNTSTNFQNLNGTPFESYNYNLTTGGLASNLSNVTIRLAGWPSNSKSGQYAEILMFDRILPQRDYQQVEGYLAWKWGLQTSLPANHPYREIPLK